jgi:hypothetical protein
MTRTFRTASEIQAEIQSRINQIAEVIEDRAAVRVLGIQPLSEFDSNGCNWTAEKFSNAKGYEMEVLRIVSEVKANINLRS